MLARSQETKPPMHCWWECEQYSHAPCGIILQFFLTLKPDLPHDSATALLDSDPRATKTSPHAETCTRCLQWLY